MCFALISFLLAPPLSAQAQTREAYVAQSADKTTLTFYYDDQRATRTGTTWGIKETKTKKVGGVAFPAWAGTFEVAERTTTRVVFDASFRDFRPTTTAWWFYNYRALKQIEGLEYLKTSEVKDMRGMFGGCSGLTSLDVSHFNTQKVTNMGEMFHNCSVLTSLDVSHFNTQNVTDMSGMFSFCSSLTSLDVSHFDTQNVTGMGGMFYYCSVLTSLDVSHFNTQNVTDMQSMFEGCWRLTSLDVSHFNTQNVTKMSSVFEGCRRLTSLDVSHFNTQNVTDMREMFKGCWDLTSLDLKNFDTQKVTNMRYMFGDCSGLTSLDVSHFNTQNVTDMYGMFFRCSGLTSLDLSHFKTQKVTDMREMFKGCGALATIKSNTAWRCPESEEMFAGCTKLKGAVPYDQNKTDVTMANPETGYFTRSNDGGVEAYVAQSADKTTLTFYYDALRATRTGTTWGIEETKEEEDATFPAWAGTFEVAESTTTRVVFDVSFRDFRPTTTARWFCNYRALKQIEGLEYLNTQNVTNMNGMFWFCSGLTSLDLSHFNTQNVTSMNGMFSHCSGLTSLDVSHFNTQNVTSMNGIFSNCSGLTSLDVSHFNTQNVTNMGAMFAGCSGLTSLDLSHFNTQNVTNMSQMFWFCSGLTSLDLSHFNTQNVTDMSEMFFLCSGLTTINSNTAWQCPRSEDMFTDCTQLKGAVAYDENNTDVTMANPETGYFTRSNDGGVEAYVAQSADKTTLTFYYDDQRATRTGTTWGFEKTKMDKFKNTYFPWTGTVLTPDETATHVVFDSSFRDFRPTSTAYWFYKCSALEQIEGLEYLNTSEVTDMRYMFNECVRLTSLNVKNFNTHKVKDMSGMFLLCSELTSLDLSHFNTQNVTKMSDMFSNCRGLTSLDLSNFSTQNVTDMGYMFLFCTSLTSLDLSHFNTQNVTDMSRMFKGCSALTTINSNAAWQCPRSEDMFTDCTQLKGAVPYNGNKTDVRMANPETGYFTRSNDGGVEAYVAQSADKTALTFYYDNQRATRPGKSWGIEETKEEEDATFPAWAGTWTVADSTTTRVVFDASFRDFRPTTTAMWFYRCEVLKQIEGLEFLNTSEVKDMGGMFSYCYSLTSLDLSHFNTRNVTDMWAMFSYCSSLTSLDLSHFNTQNVTSMYGMFEGCSGLTSLDLSHFNTQNVADMSHLFSGCSGLTSLEVSNFDTQNVTSMGSMFSGCSGLTSLDLKHFNTQNVTYMGGMFRGCSGLTSLDLKHFNTQNVTDMSWMFSGCSALTTIHCNTAWQCPLSEEMFDGCVQLKGAVPYDENKTDAKMANPETGYFTAKPTAVESVRFGADSAQHIYTLQGKRVRGEWKHLPAGVYVVNGKKTIKP